MRELTQWFRDTAWPSKPWLILGKGPTFERRRNFDLGQYNLLGMNHVVREERVDVAHIIDVDVVGDCHGQLLENAEWLLMPRYPHLRSTSSNRRLDDWFDEYPILREADERGRLVWYNLHGSPVEDGSPVIGARQFSSEAVLNILGAMGVKTVRSLGVDGGRSYAASFEDLEGSTMLSNGAPSFDFQFDRLELVAREHDLDFRPLVDPLRIFLGTDESQIVAHRVLEYSIRKSSTIPVEVVPMLNLSHPIPRDRVNRPRTAFSFYRFMIPRLCGYNGRALYLDADMVVFGDIAELYDLPFGGHKLLCTVPTPTSAWDSFNAPQLGARMVAVMLMDCERLDWEIEEIVRGLDEGRYSYEALMSDMCIVDPSEIADTIPPEWNDLEHYDPGRTKLLHYTVVPTQPWKSDDNPLGEIWMAIYREAVEAGAVPPEEVEALIAAGHVKPSLRAALRFAPSRRAVLTSVSLDLMAQRERSARLEARIAAMKRSWSWRIGDGIVRSLRVPRKLLRDGLQSVRSK